MDAQQATADAVSAATSKVVYGAAGGAIFLGFTANEVAAIGGLIVAFMAFVVNAATNWYFKSQHLKLAREKAEADDGD